MYLRHHSSDLVLPIATTYLTLLALFLGLVEGQNYHYSKDWSAGKRSSPRAGQRMIPEAFFDASNDQRTDLYITSILGNPLQNAWASGTSLTEYTDSSSLTGHRERNDGRQKNPTCGFRKEMEELLLQIIEDEMRRVHECLAEKASTKDKFPGLDDQIQISALLKKKQLKMWDWLKNNKDDN